MVKLAAVALLVVLGGCNALPEATIDGDSRTGHGRYVGVGLYSAGRMWEQIKRPAAAAKDAPDRAAAALADDSTIIVIADSVTGEIRQCGDASGFCTAMNPWTKQALGAPVSLVKHAADLDAEAAAESKKAASSR